MYYKSIRETEHTWQIIQFMNEKKNISLLWWIGCVLYFLSLKTMSDSNNSKNYSTYINGPMGL